MLCLIVLHSNITVCLKVLKSGWEEAGFRGKQLGEDYKFTRLTSDSEERLIKEETIRVKTGQCKTTPKT